MGKAHSGDRNIGKAKYVVGNIIYSKTSKSKGNGNVHKGLKGQIIDMQYDYNSKKRFSYLIMWDGYDKKTRPCKWLFETNLAKELSETEGFFDKVRKFFGCGTSAMGNDDDKSKEE